MEKRINSARFKLAFGKKKIYVYNKNREEVDVIYLDEKITSEHEFNWTCTDWYAENWEVVED